MAQSLDDPGGSFRCLHQKETRLEMKGRGKKGRTMGMGTPRLATAAGRVRANLWRQRLQHVLLTEVVQAGCQKGARLLIDCGVYAVLLPVASPPPESHETRGLANRHPLSANQKTAIRQSEPPPHNWDTLIAYKWMTWRTATGI